MSFRNAYKSLRLCFGQANLEILQPHPRINQNRNSANLEQRKGEGKKLKSRRHHQHSPHPPFYPMRLKSESHATTFTVEFGKGIAVVKSLLPIIMTGRDVNSRGLRLQARHLRKMGSNVDGNIQGHAWFPVDSSSGFSLRNAFIIGITSSAASSRM